MLVVLSGLPGVGKTTIARELAVAINAVHVRIDTIEQALRNHRWNVAGEGYAIIDTARLDLPRSLHAILSAVAALMHVEADQAEDISR